MNTFNMKEVPVKVGPGKYVEAAVTIAPLLGVVTMEVGENAYVLTMSRVIEIIRERLLAGARMRAAQRKRWVGKRSRAKTKRIAKKGA